MSNDQVSIILPVQAGSNKDWFHEAVASVTDLSNDELIVIVDGYDEEMSDLAHALAVNILIEQPSLGVGVARNRGIAVARNDFIAFIDADDEWLPRKLEKQLKALDRARDTMAFASSKVDHYLEPSHELPATLKADRLGVRDMFLPSNLLCHKDVFRLVGGFDPHLPCANDVDWYRRAMRLGVRRVHVDEVLVRKRVHSTNLSMGQGHDMQRQMLEVLSRKVVPQMFPVLPDQRAAKYKAALVEALHVSLGRVPTEAEVENYVNGVT